MIVYNNCRLVDGTGAEAVENAVLITDKSKILYAGASESAPLIANECQIVDLKGKTALPGLFNCHVHMALRFPFTSYCVDEYGTPGYRAMVMYRRAIEAMYCGVTTIRATGEADYADLAVRDAINKNMVMGPRILTAGPIIIAHGGHGAGSWGAMECSGQDDFRRATRIALFKGVDFIKICITGGMVGEHEGASTMQMTEEEIAAVTSVARNSGKVVAAHLGNDAAIRAAVRNGVKSIEHAYIMNRETAAILAASDAYLVPTLAVSNACDYLEKHRNPRYHIEKIRAIGKLHQESVANAVKEGVKIAVGTDLLPSDPLDGTNATVRECELLCEAGMSALQAIRAATVNSAELCGVYNTVGSLTVGKEADFIVCDGRPDQNIRDLRRLKLVVKGGSLVWSKVEGYEKQGFSVLPFGETPMGASFINW